jgi:hypothetical protein
LVKGGPVDPVAVLLRDRTFVFLDPRFHFLEQLAGQRFLAGHILFKPLILLFQIIEHIFVIDLRIALVFEPVIGIADRIAMAFVTMGSLLGDRWFFHFLCHGLFCCWRFSESGSSSQIGGKQEGE